ncbi:hypothetical protein HYU89_04595 [Candidatus Collierbacteria bacterium]|nr:hypothetical protein [Candidatus Collierbacteria bacterium]
MAEILGPALNLRFYESPKGFDIKSLAADLRYFIREQGPEVVKQLLPQFPRELLTRLQYAPDHFSYHLTGGKLVASEDLHNRNFTDARSRVDKNEPERGAGAFLVLEKVAGILADENKSKEDGENILWASPKEGFSSRHAYINIGTIGRDNSGSRKLSVSSYMSDFSLPELRSLIANLTGLNVPPEISPRILSGMVFQADHKDLIAACNTVFGPGRTIEGVSIGKLYGAGSGEIWQAIRQVVKDGGKKIAEVVNSAEGEIEKMQIGMAQTVFGFIESVLELIGKEKIPEIAREKLSRIPTENFLAAFMTAAAGCIGSLMPSRFGGATFSAVPVLGIENNRVHCPNCKKTVSCAIGETCPGCRQIRPC